MSSSERKDDSLLKLQKKLERSKKAWLAKNAQKQMKFSSGVEDEDVNPREKYPFIKDWQDCLQQKSIAKKLETPVRDSLDLEIAKRAHDKEVKERRKEKLKTKTEKRELLPAIKTFVQKRTMLNKKKVDFSRCGSIEDVMREKGPLPALDENESENEALSSDDENINSLEGVFLCGFKSDVEATNTFNIQSEDILLSKIQCFAAKPSKVIFKNFDVEQIYKQKVKLINVHSAPLSCKLIGINDDEVNKFIDLELRAPPKQIMPGMNCTLTVRFFPKDEDIDLESSIFMRTELGLFSIPLEIRKKFCCVSVQPTEIDFGIHVVGSSSLQRFHIFNHGTKVASYKVSTPGKRSETTSGSRSLSAAKAESKEQTADKSETLSSVVSEKKSSSVDDYQYSNNEFLIETGSQSLVTPSSDDISLLKSLTRDVEDSDLIGLELNSKSEGQIAGNGKVTIEISYKPQIPGQVRASFIVETSDFKARTFYVEVKAEASLPYVKVKENSYNLNICAYSHLYQENITLVNDGNNKHDITIEIPKELRNHIEILPKNGVIKPQSEFIAQIRLNPKNSISSDAVKFFDESTGILEFFVSFHVSEQPVTLKTTIHAILSSVQVEFEPDAIDFGECYINENVQVDVVMRNLGILTQQFGFVHVINCINIEPNDGFGIILPKETIGLKIIFKPDIAVKYNSTLICKTLFNRTFTIKWTGVGVYSPIKLSPCRVNFAATYLNNISTASISIKNNKRDDKLFISYEFDVPDYCPVKIYPNSGQISGGKSQKLNLIFSPKLLQQQILYEAKIFALNSEEPESESPEGTTTEEGTEEGTVKSLIPTEELKEERIFTPDSQEYKKAVEKLTCEFEDRVELYTISCYFIEGQIEDLKGKEKFSDTRPINLSLSCPLLKPKMKLLSPERIDFGKVSIGNKSVTSIEICNITSEKLQVEAIIANVQERFTLLKPKISIPGKSSGKFAICFFPMEENDFFEKLDICCSGNETVSVILMGQAVKPELILSFLDDAPVLNLNFAVVGDYSNANFTVTNPTEIDLQLRFHFVEIINEDDKTKNIFYCRNFSGLNPFSINPMQLTLESKQTASVTATFSPDHSHSFLGWIKLILFDNYVLRKFAVQGIGSKSQVHLSGDNMPDLSLSIISNINAIRAFATNYDENKISFGPLIDDDAATCLVFSNQTFSNKLDVTLIQSNLNPVKKAAEFVIENLPAAEKIGFSFEITKGLLEVGKTLSIMVTYTPEKDNFKRVDESEN